MDYLTKISFTKIMDRFKEIIHDLKLSTSLLDEIEHTIKTILAKEINK